MQRPWNSAVSRRNSSLCDQAEENIVPTLQYQAAVSVGKDILCLRVERVVDSYRKISLSGLELKVPGVFPRQSVELRLYPDIKTGLTEVLFWWKNHLTGVQ